MRANRLFLLLVTGYQVFTHRAEWVDLRTNFRIEDFPLDRFELSNCPAGKPGAGRGNAPGWVRRRPNVGQSFWRFGQVSDRVGRCDLQSLFAIK